ncbi:MAG: OmpH family outer membrane protein [Sphingobacteriales bacterium]|nr:OmpH family outer membrane protein [Sphingobacteriales bacterium]
MKKILTVIAIVGLLAFSGSANAQTKIGYIKIDDLVSLFPETAKIDSVLERFQVDSLNPEYASLVQRYQWDDSLYRDSVKTPKAVRDEIAKKLPAYIYQIQNWQQLSNQALENKQNEILAPLYRKAYEAIKQVAKEKGYTHVISKETLLVAPDGDDMLALVAAKLKLKIPTGAPAGK